MTTKKNEDKNQVVIPKKPEIDEKCCFIVAPIGANGSDVRRATEGLMDAVLRPLLGDKFGYKVEIAHEISVSGSITDQIINNLLESELVVVDLTGLNPNVMYELAIRHCTGLPLIVMARDGTDLPFDVVQERTIFYHNDMHGVVELSARLEAAVEAIHESGGQIDTPVSRARQSRVVKEKIMSGEGKDADVAEFLLNQLSEIKNLIVKGGGSGNSTSYIAPERDVDYDTRNIRLTLMSAGYKVKSFARRDKGDGVELHIGFENELSESEIDVLRGLISQFKIKNGSIFVRDGMKAVRI